MIGSGFQNIFRVPELKKRVLFALMMLVVYRIGVHVPTPGINREALGSLFAQSANTLFAMFDMFSGGALEQFSVFALGIMPYISASIILQLLTVMVPYLERLKKEGEPGRRKITIYTRYLTVGLSIFQGLGISIGLENMAYQNAPVVLEPGWSFRLITVITLTAGTAFIMWLGEQITERGIGNGISLIISAGIIAGIPSAVSKSLALMRTGDISAFLIVFLVVMMVVVVGCIIFVEQGQRRIPIHYAKRVVGNKMYGGQTSHLPLKVNTSGVIPAIFASSIIMFPATITSFVDLPGMKMVTDALMPGRLLYEILFVGFIFFFCFFYTAIVFNPLDVAENLRKNGGYIPGIRPGKRTSDYIDKVLTRLTLSGAVYVSAICVLPSILISQFHVPFYFGGTALLIVVSVCLDTVAQMESHMITRNYEGFLNKKIGRFRGRNG